MPVSADSTNSRWVFQNTTAIRMDNNTTPTQRQNSDTNAITNTDNSRCRSSSKSVQRRSRRVCAIAIMVAVRFFRDANSPSFAILDSAASFSLAPTNEQADYKANTSRNANRLPWVFVHILIGYFGRDFGLFH